MSMKYVPTSSWRLNAYFQALFIPAQLGLSAFSGDGTAVTKYNAVIVAAKVRRSWNMRPPG